MKHYCMIMSTLAWTVFGIELTPVSADEAGAMLRFRSRS